MTDPKRLFDCIALQLENKPLEDMLAGKTAGQWKTFSTREVAETVNQISAGLLGLGIGPNDMTVEGRDKVAEVSKKWLRLRDSYGVSIDPGQDDVLILAVAVCIDEMAHGGR